MSKDLNQCSFIGRLGKDISLNYTAGGTAIANFSIACSDDYKDKNTGQKVDQTNWINIVMFGKRAELAGQYLKKGSRIYISGKQVTRKWQDQSGQDKYTTEIHAENMQFLDVRQDNSSGAPNQGHAPQQQPQQRAPVHQETALPVDEFLNEIPF